MAEIPPGKQTSKMSTCTAIPTHLTSSVHQKDAVRAVASRGQDQNAPKQHQRSCCHRAPFAPDAVSKETQCDLSSNDASYLKFAQRCVSFVSVSMAHGRAATHTAKCV